MTAPSRGSGRLHGLGGHGQLRPEAPGPSLSHQASLMDGSQGDLLGCFGAEAIWVEGQRVLKVRVHPAHDVGAELPGRGYACLWLQESVPSHLPRLLRPPRGVIWRRVVSQAPTPALLHPSIPPHTPISPPTHPGHCGTPLAPGKSLRGRKGAANMPRPPPGVLCRPTPGPPWERDSDPIFR